MSSPSATDLIEKLSVLSKEMTDTLQDPLFESLAYGHRERVSSKIRSTDFSSASIVYLGHHLAHARPVTRGRHYVHLSSEFLEQPAPSMPDGSIVLLLNNDIGPALPRYIDFYLAHPRVLFVVWDWDSQHWIQMSTMLAMNCDVYIPSTSENVFLLSHFNSCMLGPVCVGVHQWTRRFLYDHINLMTGPRADTPFGPHVFYGKYPKRNRIVATLARHFESIRFADNQYKVKTDEENLREWASYKSHWIVPVLGGVPIRVYNALITGGIPIVPSFYRNMPEVASLGGNTIFYDVNDVIEPQAINSLANELFASEEDGGLIQRITEGLATQHVDTRCEQILLSLEQVTAAHASGKAATLPGHYKFAPDF